MPQALVSVIMGSKSDWDTMAHAVQTLDRLGVPCEVRVLSAHRTPDQLFEYVKAAEGQGVEVFIAAAGGIDGDAGALFRRDDFLKGGCCHKRSRGDNIAPVGAGRG